MLRPYPVVPIADFRLAKKDTYDETDKHSDQFDLSILSEEAHLDKLAAEYDHRYKVSDWVNVNTVITISWNEWIDFDTILRRAIVNRTNEITRQRQANENKIKDDFEMKLASSANMNIKDISNTNIGRIMSR